MLHCTTTLDLMPLFQSAPTGRFRPSQLFRPESVAVVGAGTVLGGLVMQNMLGAGFKGAILPVQPGVAAVGGVLASVVGRTSLYVSGGAEHQGPPGGGPVAVILRMDATMRYDGGT